MNEENAAWWKTMNANCQALSYDEIDSILPRLSPLPIRPEPRRKASGKRKRLIRLLRDLAALQKGGHWPPS